MADMTSHYVNLTVLPDAETNVPALLGSLFDRLHRALVQRRLDSIGVSFPGYSVIPRGMGDTLRLHGEGAVLGEFLASDWLRGMRDHVRVSDVTPVPADALHRNLRRRQFKTNVERLRRRRMKRKGESAEEAARAIPTTAADVPHLPYVQLRSLSTGQAFCLFIAMGELRHDPVPGRFNTYGLGEQGTTVPWF